MTDVATTAKPDVKVYRENPPKVLSANRMKPSGDDYWTYTIRVPAGWDFEEVMKPIFWSSVAANICGNKLASTRSAVGSKVEVRTEDHAYIADLYIYAADQSGVDVRCIGPACDPKTGKPCALDLKTGLPIVPGKAKAEDAPSETPKTTAAKAAKAA